MKPFIAIVVGLAAGILGYGWWHATTHASINLTLLDAAGKGYEHLKGAQLAFLDESGKVLARGKTDEKFGVAWVYHPTVGYCGPELSLEAYTPCFRAHSEWLPAWVPQVR